MEGNRIWLLAEKSLSKKSYSAMSTNRDSEVERNKRIKRCK